MPTVVTIKEEGSTHALIFLHLYLGFREICRPNYGHKDVSLSRLWCLSFTRNGCRSFTEKVKGGKNLVNYRLLEKAEQTPEKILI